MGTFNHLKVNGFRRLMNVDLPLRPLCVLVGANGVGKTSLLDVFGLLAASAEGKLNTKISDFSGIVSLINYNSFAQCMSVGLSMSVTPPTPVNISSPDSTSSVNYAPLEYWLQLSAYGQGYRIDRETLSQQRFSSPPPFMHIDSHIIDVKYFEPDQNRLVRPNWDYNSLETSLSQVPKMFQEPEDFRSRLASSTFYHVLNVEQRAPVRLPQPMRPAKLPGKDGEDLVTCLYYLRETDRNRFEAIEDALHAAFPSFERLDFPPVAAGTISMAWKDASFTRPVYTHQLSEGTLRFLWLATLLQSPGLASVTLLDEPEVSMHPELLSLLAALMREASERTQLIVATHSDRLVSFLQPEEVAVMDVQEDGSSSITWADQLDLGQWLAEYSLDEVWRMGRMGGRA